MICRFLPEIDCKQILKFSRKGIAILFTALLVSWALVALMDLV